MPGIKLIKLNWVYILSTVSSNKFGPRYITMLRDFELKEHCYFKHISYFNSDFQL